MYFRLKLYYAVFKYRRIWKVIKLDSFKKQIENTVGNSLIFKGAKTRLKSLLKNKEIYFGCPLFLEEGCFYACVALTYQVEAKAENRPLLFGTFHLTEVERIQLSNNTHLNKTWTLNLICISFAVRRLSWQSGHDGNTL